MADNFIANPGAGGDTFSADDVGGVKYPYSKIDAGGDGLSVPMIAGQQAMSASFPIVVASDQTALPMNLTQVNGSTVQTSAAGTILVGNTDATGNGYLSASTTMNASSGAGLFPSVAVSQYDDVAPTTITEGRFGNTRISANRNLYTTIRDAAGNERGLNVDASGNIAVTDGGASLTVDGTVAATQSGTWDIGSITTLPTLANVTTVATVTNITNQGQLVDNAAFTDGTTRLMMSGYIFDEVAGTALTENDGAAARVDSKRAQVLVVEDATTRGRRMTVNSDGSVPHTNVASATGGATPGKLISAASTNATSVKASAGTLYSLMVTSVNAAARYIKLYNKASAPTVGTDTPVLVYGIPGNTAGNGFTVHLPPCGVKFSTGIAFALTTGIADSDTGAVAANEIAVSYAYL